MDPEADEAEAPPPSRPSRLARWGRPIGVALGGAAAALLGVLVFVGAPPIWPFLTSGRIYVESPGVYTRERLVNDRYSQDFWLKTQLERLDASDDLLRRYRQRAFGLGAEAPTEPGAAPGDAGANLAFQDEFILRAAIRDKIRQMVLENLLDDRHDLTGNSIYGLKFETAVVPGANTVLRPYVVVRIDAETLPADRAAPDFLADASSAHNSQTGGVFDSTRRQYNGWRRNVEGRLNGYVERAAQIDGCTDPETPVAAPEAAGASVEAGSLVAADAEDAEKATAFTPAAASAGPGPDLWTTSDGWAGIDRDLVLDALRQIMGVEPREAAFLPWRQGGEFGSVTTPEPWSRFFQVQVWPSKDIPGGADVCGVPYSIQLKPVFASVLLVEPEEWDGFRTTAPVVDQPSVRIISSMGEGPEERRVMINQRPQGDVWTASSAERTFVESLTSAELDRLRARPDSAVARDACLVAASQDDAKTATTRGECLLSGDRYVIHASQYDFVRAIAQSIPYSYAVFPRGDVEGVLTDRSLAGGGEAPGGIGFSGLDRTREVGAEPIVVNFAGGQSQDAKAGDFDFGWAVVRAGRQRPMQVSQLVLVSVPAYLDSLDLWVETGWLDRDSSPIGPRPTLPEPGVIPPPEVAGERRLVRMTVALPPDYEAIDTLVVGGTRRQGPVIDDLAFDGADIAVRACQRADILIPGDRLWRSTTVTLGGQIADRITVMPDMRGIVASFEPVAPPPGVGGEQEAWTEETLAVWTSEGSATVPKPIAIRVPHDVAVAGACVDGRAGSGDDLAGDPVAVAGAADR